MPKLDLKVKNWQIEFLKNQLLCGDNAKLCRGGVNHDPNFLLGSLMISKKKFSPCLAFFCSPKKNKLKSLSCAKCQKIINLASWRKQLSCKPPVLQSSHVFLIINHIWSGVTRKISVSRLMLVSKRPENRYFWGTKGNKTII